MYIIVQLLSLTLFLKGNTYCTHVPVDVVLVYFVDG